MEISTAPDPHLRCLAGARRSRNRGRGQILAGNTKPSTLQFDSDFDFEKANAQFNKDDLEKEIEDQLSVQGMWFYVNCLRFSTPDLSFLCALVCWSCQNRRRARKKGAILSLRARALLKRIHSGPSASTIKPSASLITSPRSSSPGMRRLWVWRERFLWVISLSVSRRTTWAEERKLNVETFGVPGRFLRGRGFRGNYRGRWGRGAAQHPVPQRVGSGRL